MRATRSFPMQYCVLGVLLVLVSQGAAQQSALPETAPTAAGDKLRETLSRALEDERHAIAFYEAVIARHGDKRPFSNIVDAERRHADALTAQFERLKLASPADPWKGRTIAVPATLAECCDAAEVAEIRNIRMYDELLPVVSDERVAAVFRQLRAASQDRHLPAFRRHGSGWRTVAEAELSPEQRGQLKLAVSAREAMFTALMTRLQAEIERAGLPGAIDVCRSASPAIADEVSRQQHVQIGRTSWKLRNPANAGPIWTGLVLDEKPDTPRFVAARDGRLGVTLPIKLAASCLACHGPPERLDPGVRRKLQEMYPEDQAVGFQEGDLRGWFWVEVPVPKR